MNVSKCMAVVAIAFLFSMACGPSSSTDGGDASLDGPGGDATMDVDAAPAIPTVHFTLPPTGLPDPLEVPWPTDLYRADPDGTIVDTLTNWRSAFVGGADGTFVAYGALDGFGRETGALFLLDGVTAIDPATLPRDGEACMAAGGSVAIVDIDARSTTPFTRIRCAAAYVVRAHVLTVTPDDTVLAAGRTYAVVVTDGVRTMDGTALRASAAFASIRDNAPGARDSAAGRLYGPVVDQLEMRAGIDHTHLVGLSVFTTQTTHRRLQSVRDVIDRETFGPAPRLITTGLVAPQSLRRLGAHAHAGWDATLDEAFGTPRRGTDGRDMTGIPTVNDPMGSGFPHDAIGAIVTAAFTSPEFRRPFRGTPDRNDGTIVFDAMGAPTAQVRDARVPVTIFMPLPPVPARGYPVVIFQHGLGGNRGNALGLVNEFNRAGIAVAAIDAPLHGLRAAGAVATTCTAPGTYRGPDSLPDMPDPLTPFHFLGDLTNMLALRDNLYQLVSEIVQLRHLLSNPMFRSDLAVIADEYGGTPPSIDPTQIGYVGMSMGGLTGVLVAAVEPRGGINPFVLNVPGGGLFTTLIPASGVIGSAVMTFGVSLRLPSGVPFDRFNPWFQLCQGLFDGADPAVFAGEVRAASRPESHDVYILTAANDDTAPPMGSDLLARELGARQVTPAIRTMRGVMPSMSPLLADPATGRTRGIFEVSPGNHGHLLARHQDMVFEPPIPRDGAAVRFPRLATAIPARQSTLAAQRSVLRFLQSSWSGSPEIVVTGPEFTTLAPVADFDDDGFCDDQERAAMTNPYDRMSRPASGSPNCVRDLGY